MVRTLLLILCIIGYPFHVSAATILFLGDSLTAGYGVEADEAFPEIIRKRLGHENPAALVINGGVSGSTSAGALYRLQWYRPQPNILFLALGANDGLRGLSTRELFLNLEKTIAYAQGHGTRVILAGMEVPPNYGRDYAQAFREVYAKLALQTGVMSMPFLLKGVAGIPEYNLGDGIHPNAEGHRKIADNVYPYITRALKNHMDANQPTKEDKEAD